MATAFKFTVGKIYIHPWGLATEQVVEGVRAICSMFRRRYDLPRLVPTFGTGGIRIRSARLIHDGQHVRGMYSGGRELWLHSGQVSDGVYEAMFTTPQQIGQIVMHEWGHMMGLEHPKQTRDIMHSNAAPNLISSLPQFREWFG